MAERWHVRRLMWMPTSLDYRIEADTTYLRDVYVNGVRFTRAAEEVYVEGEVQGMPEVREREAD